MENELRPRYKDALILLDELGLSERTCKVDACYSPSDLSSEDEWYFAFSCGCELYWDEAIPPNYCPNCGARVVTCSNTSDSNYFRCSVCQKKTYLGEEVFDYCPNCGARRVDE